MEWSKSDSIKLIELYREHECLWNPNHNDYKNKRKKSEAWNNLSDVMVTDPNVTIKKMESLLGSFRRERQKQETDVKFKSTWFAFKYMVFLLDKFTPRTSKDTEADDEDSVLAVASSSEINFSLDEELDEPEFKSTQLSAPKKTLVYESGTPSITLQSRSKRLSENTSADETDQIRKDHVSYHRDSSTIYGEHVAAKHRKYSDHTQSVVEHLIGNILFNADMGKYDPTVASVATLQSSHDQCSSTCTEKYSTRRTIKRTMEDLG